MEYRQLGRSGLRVSTLALGAATFGGKGALGLWGSTDVAGARRLIDRCVGAGVNLVDTADAYSSGLSEEILGEALQGGHADVLVATKARLRMGDGPNDAGLSRHHLIEACEASLRRLRRDHIDLYQVHTWDGQTPLEETLSALDVLVRSGKVRYIGCSNFSGWQLMKAAGVADRRGYEQFAAQQIYLSLQSRDAEHEMMPAAIDLGVGTLVWSPLAGGLLSGKYRRDVVPEGTARHLGDNCGYGHGYSVRQVLDSVQRVAGKRIEIREEVRREGDPPALVAAADRVRAVLGWEPRLDDLDGIVRTALRWEERLQREPW